MAHSSCHFYSLWISKGETKTQNIQKQIFQKAGIFFWQEPGNVSDKVVYAVNCGGDSHVDILGVHFSKDSNKVGTASDYGKQLLIGRVPQKDQILYQTERYHTSTFGYDIPIATDGRYLLVLKFSEVYFNTPNSKVNLKVMIEKWDLDNKNCHHRLTEVTIDKTVAFVLKQSLSKILKLKSCWLIFDRDWLFSNWIFIDF